MQCRNCLGKIVPEKVNGYLHENGIVSCGVGSLRAEPPVLREIEIIPDDEDDFSALISPVSNANELVRRHGLG